MKLYPFYFSLDCKNYSIAYLGECERDRFSALSFLLVIAAEFPPSLSIFRSCPSCLSASGGGSGGISAFQKTTTQKANLGVVHLSLQQTPQNCEPLQNGILQRCRRFGAKTAQLQPLFVLPKKPKEAEEPTENPQNPKNPDAPDSTKPAARLLAKKTAAQLDEYFCGRRRVFELPLLLLGTAFQLRAWQQLAKIPYAETAYYEQQAIACGNARASRAIGMANHDNPLLLLLPCHRVLGKNGKLTGFRPGLAYKQYFLALERHYTAR